MKKLILLLLIEVLFSCSTKITPPSAQQIIDKSIQVAGGHFYENSEVTFVFRDKKYVSIQNENEKTYKRITFLDSLKVTDIKTPNGFERYLNDNLVKISDSLALRYSNSINSVHYFSRLPFGLNDRAVNKKFLGETEIAKKKYYKVRVTFDQEEGGDDFEDVYLYWFNKDSFKPDYLAYEFHTDGGGMRFRKAYNERFVNGIRFVDYENYKGVPTAFDFKKILSVSSIASYFSSPNNLFTKAGVVLL